MTHNGGLPSFSSLASASSSAQMTHNGGLPSGSSFDHRIQAMRRATEEAGLREQDAFAKQPSEMQKKLCQAQRQVLQSSFGAGDISSKAPGHSTAYDVDDDDDDDDDDNDDADDDDDDDDVLVTC